jgi:hypothetical protein
MESLLAFMKTLANFYWQTTSNDYHTKKEGEHGCKTKKRGQGRRLGGGGGWGKACEKGTLEAMDNYQYQRPQPTDFLIYCQRGGGRGYNAGSCKFRKRWRIFCTQQEAERGWGGVRTSDKIIRKQIFAN